MKETIQQLAKQYLPEMVAARRHFHQNPELANEEFETQRYVQAFLTNLGIENFPLAGTGVVGLIHGGHPGKTVLLRADMDALPVLEAVDIPYRSSVEGLMHACGHDGHTAGLMGAAMILNDVKEHLHGTVKLMFQPAEETTGGAQPMIDAGLLENPHVDAAFGLHLGGHLEHGKVQVRYGAMFGAPDEFEVTITGRGGHAASPEQTIDPISVAVQFIQNAQFILTRRIDPVKPALVSFTTIHAGEGLNVIPQTCTVGGTIRTLYPETRKTVSALLEATLESLCTVNGATYDFNYMPSYPPLINDDAMTRLAHQSLINYFGEDTVLEQEFPSLGAEDFAYLALAVPSSYYYVGIYENGKPEPIHHHPEFAWNDDVLETTSASLATIAIDYLNQQDNFGCLFYWFDVSMIRGVEHHGIIYL
ncbi:amidohydrolase [Erysipelothrix sp. HDW6C]|uniref:M20 metallopeptidase family protein n=1 Tax=Erysipelothrix sp. HDW6C TaxID=2714930 RepID=UPI001408F283|nr:M20 family metallopeptidase [Erysipelothrix sp. HDW6C]QIK69039.1 amidohydrolase [Erysipelothrix sp. HDW6C]